jgi:hypothetical protein
MALIRRSLLIFASCRMRKFLNVVDRPWPGEALMLKTPDRFDPSIGIRQAHHRMAELVRRADDPLSTIAGDTRVNIEWYVRDPGMFQDI